MAKAADQAPAKKKWRSRARSPRAFSTSTCSRIWRSWKTALWHWSGFGKFRAKRRKRPRCTFWRRPRSRNRPTSTRPVVGRPVVGPPAAACGHRPLAAHASARYAVRRTGLGPDPEMTKEVLDTMIELAEKGMTMLFVTHEMGFARQVANRVIFMDAGQIVEQNEPAEFFNNPRSDRTRPLLSQILGH